VGNVEADVATAQLDIRDSRGNQVDKKIQTHNRFYKIF
jgi:hypothetical protein